MFIMYFRRDFFYLLDYKNITRRSEKLGLNKKEKDFAWHHREISCFWRRQKSPTKYLFQNIAHGIHVFFFLFCFFFDRQSEKFPCPYTEKLRFAWAGLFIYYL